MAIQELEVHGYRSFKDVTWRPGSLNLLVGPNASGKSNLLRLLQLISDVAKGRLSDTLSESAGIASLLWNHEAKRFGWKLRLDPVDENRDKDRDAITFQLEIEQIRRGGGYQI